MEPQDAYQGFSPSAYGAPAAYVPPAPVVPDAQGPAPLLRPLSTGEILDRTLALYRRRFWLFAGIGAVPAVVLTLSNIVRMIVAAYKHLPTTFSPGTAPNAVANAMGTMMLLQVYFLPATLLFLVAYAISHAATADAVGLMTRGLTPSIAESYRHVQGRWLRWSGIALRQIWSAVWPVTIGAVILLVSIGVLARRGNTLLTGIAGLVGSLLMIAGSVFGILNFLRNALATPAGVSEDMGVNAAMRRSKQLAAGRKGRIFLALLLVYVLQMVAGGIQIPFVLMASTTRGAQHVLLLAIELVVGFVATMLVTPVASIALYLIYVDERVRREGYDIEVLMERSLVPVASDVLEV
ncbi:hypothetical protein Terro_1003 [Terriglobus roseus DSM 18391]|uniref:Glycerophosphoryl diester phosphodiesterase membrane domain-containing protein n=1 Tax=Terriglobus roseus (strain DSM 18391 / NRRL B-41598 / KBS 63) TaxID=926566 RepID=I3ZDK6_TERRK|nr:hypothetical protein [Terriglobus roseus]AFL87324.1 hypothetical protein Terro_1003 [Terriglobus roseus DSM 18391]